MNDRPKQAVLLYAGACPKCRWISKTIVILSLGSIRRVPLDREEAEQFYRVEHRDARGKPALAEGDRMTYGWAVLLSVPRLLLTTWLSRLVRLVTPSGARGLEGRAARQSAFARPPHTQTPRAARGDNLTVTEP